MTRVLSLVILIVAALAVPPVAGAQPVGKISRIGYLSPRAGPSVFDEAFRQGLRELGYVEGTNIAVEYRWAAWSPDRLRGHAADLVRLKVDLIVATGGGAIALAAKSATTTIPIVFAVGGDPKSLGLVSSLARPGGNLTGITLLAVELVVKRLGLLRELLPGASRVAVLSNPTSAASEPQLKDLQRAAQSLGIRIRVLEVPDLQGLDQAFGTLARDRADGLLLLSDPRFNDQRAKIVDLAMRHHVPTIYEWREFVDAGGLMSYGTSLGDMYRRLASYIDKILKGAKPADLPVEQPTKFDLCVNLKTAKALGLTIPPAVLARADEIIQ
jgi:ABC-type uncharacterized transport system substrate-binding protein